MITGKERKMVKQAESGYDTMTKENKISEMYDWESCREEYLVTIALNQNKVTASKKNNLIKIYKIIMDMKIKFQGLKMVGFNRAEVTYKSRQDANAMLARSRLQPTDYITYIPNRWKFRKGVINEWEDSIEELEDQLKMGPNQGRFTLERLKRRKMKDGKVTWEEGKAILIKMQGESLPTRLLIGFGHVWLNVQPFVEAVKQCFRCLRFGHIQAMCKTPERKCFLCAKSFHGGCTENPRCINCNGNHTSTARECPAYQREATIKKIMAHKNLTYRGAEEIVRREEKLVKYGNEGRGMEEYEEDVMGTDFPALRKNIKIEYWEKLDFPVEKEIVKLRKVWEKNKDQRGYQREDPEKEEWTQYDNRRPEENIWGHSSRVLKNNKEFKRRNEIPEDTQKKPVRSPGREGEQRWKNENNYRKDRTQQYIPRKHNLDTNQKTISSQGGGSDKYNLKNEPGAPGKSGSSESKT
ncbi:uncharacterized protein LOC143377046 [Andrena cerasifolii]|uniref:uncharacterized protein LOC143377046 n=1 Tax=Andrena cerasifolii TaxID=2819439 RepID=UPI0040382FFF